MFLSDFKKGSIGVLTQIDGPFLKPFETTKKNKRPSGEREIKSIHEMKRVAALIN
jgi:hypothetical protein